MEMLVTLEHVIEQVFSLRTYGNDRKITVSERKSYRENVSEIWKISGRNSTVIIRVEVVGMCPTSARGLEKRKLAKAVVIN